MGKLTIRELAQAAGVSIATASYVLNNKPGKVSDATRQKVLDLARELGFRPNPHASQLRGSSRTLLVLLPESEDPVRLRGILMDCPFFNEFIAGVEHAAYDQDLQIAFVRVEQGDQIRQLRQGATPAGVLVLGKHSRETLADLEAWQAPVLVVDDKGYFADHPTAGLQDYSQDDARLGELAADHLLSLGHRKLVLLFGPLEQSVVHKERLLGVRRALQHHGVPFHSEDLLEAEVTLDGVAAVAGAIEQKLAQGATAILAMADIMAVACFKHLFTLGYRIPEQVSLMGIDNLHILNYLPLRLTTVGQDVFGRGYQAVCQLQGQPLSPSPAILIPGQSTGPVSID